MDYMNKIFHPFLGIL